MKVINRPASKKVFVARNLDENQRVVFKPSQHNFQYMVFAFSRNPNWLNGLAVFVEGEDDARCNIYVDEMDGHLELEERKEDGGYEAEQFDAKNYKGVCEAFFTAYFNILQEWG